MSAPTGGHTPAPPAAQAPSLGRFWVRPIAALTSVAIGLFAVLYCADHYVTGGVGLAAPENPLLRYFLFDPAGVSNSVAGLGGLIAAILGIVITVVSIVVQLAAGRYSGVADKFFRDRTNLFVLGYYIVACVVGVWLALSVRADFVPRASLIAMLFLTTLGLVLMAPYFAYVFWFLEPENIIGRIRRDALENAREGGATPSVRDCDDAQAELVGALEEFTDIASGSISGKDKIIASQAVDALKDFAVDYVRAKHASTEAWFKIGAQIRKNPAFVAMDPESRRDLEARRTWVEWKVLHQLLGIYAEALLPMRDVAYLIAIDTRYIAEAAAAADDAEGVQLVIRYMNSYMRQTLNAREVRTAYNVLNQYRLLVESLLKMRRGAEAVQALEHMKYYGHVSQEAKLLFVTETVAYDMADACRLASEIAAPEEERILTLLLDLDRPVALAVQEAAPPGVRKAQAKLAGYYLLAGKQARADRIRDDMKSEPWSRLRALRDELLKVESKDFWEIIDRGRNFDYVAPDQRACLKRFFAFLDEEPPGAGSESGTTKMVKVGG